MEQNFDVGVTLGRLMADCQRMGADLRAHEKRLRALEMPVVKAVTMTVKDWSAIVTAAMLAGAMVTGKITSGDALDIIKKLLSQLL